VAKGRALFLALDQDRKERLGAITPLHLLERVLQERQELR